jgi:acyl CoA:acetate/3-ketoacid CoA transferase alpha subunit
MLSSVLRRYFACSVYPSAAEAVADIHHGAHVGVGGFGICGIPEKTLDAVKNLGIRNLTMISCNAGIDNVGPGVLVWNH